MINKMDSIRNDFQINFKSISDHENTPVLPEWFPPPFPEDRMIANWISGDLFKRMIVEETPEDDNLIFDAFTDKGGENYEYDDLYIRAYSVNKKADLIYRIYRLWFIENKTPVEMNDILQKHSKDLNTISVCIEPELASFLYRIASKNETDVDRIVNELIRKNMEIIQMVEHEPRLDGFM